MSIYHQIATRIIKEQELIIGPLAWSEARKVVGLKVIDKQAGQKDFVEFSSDTPTESQEVINRLVAQYERLFGRASREVCREVVNGIIVDLQPSEIPTSLR